MTFNIKDEIKGNHNALENKTLLQKSDINFLLEFCQNHPETYNKIGNLLYSKMGISSAALNLLCTFVCVEMENKKGA